VYCVPRASQAIIVNLDVVNAAHYKPSVRVWEDLEFNLRISGRERQDGGGSTLMGAAWAMAQSGGGVWIKEDTKSRNGQLILDVDDPPGPAVICKCYHFAYYQDQMIAKQGGCREDQLHEEEDTGEEEKVTGAGIISCHSDEDYPAEKRESLRKEITELKRQLELVRIETEQEIKAGMATDFDKVDTLLSCEKQLEANLQAKESELTAYANSAQQAAEREMRRQELRETMNMLTAELEHEKQEQQGEDWTNRCRSIQLRYKEADAEMQKLDSI
jgi:hypothetical protein